MSVSPRQPLTCARPVISLRVFRYRNFSIGCVVAFCIGVGMYGSVYLLPVFLSQVSRYNAMQIGTVMTVTLLVTPPATARLLARNLRQMTLWGVAFGVGEAIVGLMLSYHLSAAPGATIGLVAAATFAVVYGFTLPRRMPHHHRPLD